jgi:hypothetical protein
MKTIWAEFEVSRRESGSQLPEVGLEARCGLADRITSDLRA